MKEKYFKNEFYFSNSKIYGIDNFASPVFANNKVEKKYNLNSITVFNIMAKRTDAKGTATRSLPPLVLIIK